MPYSELLSFDTSLGLSAGQTAQLVAVLQNLAAAAELEPAEQMLASLARALTGADAASLATREAGELYDVGSRSGGDSDSAATFWTGEQPPLASCFSGVVLDTGRAAVVDDIAACAAPAAASYRHTFVRSLAIVPVRLALADGGISVIAALGVYWAEPRRPEAQELAALRTVAAIAALALAKVDLHRRAQEALSAREEHFAKSTARLREPFAPLQRELQSLLRALEPAQALELGQAREVAKRVAVDLASLAEQVDEVAAVAASTHGVLTLATEPVELGELVRQVMREMLDTAQAADCALHLTIHAAARGEWDRSRLTQTVRCLLRSAIFYGAKGAVEIYVAANDELGRLVLRSRGLAMPPRELGRIFEPFELAVDGGRASDTVLGLWLARHLIEAHGGKLEVVSEPGAGSSFTVLLPLGTRD